MNLTSPAQPGKVTERGTLGGRLGGQSPLALPDKNIFYKTSAPNIEEDKAIQVQNEALDAKLGAILELVRDVPEITLTGCTI